MGKKSRGDLIKFDETSFASRAFIAKLSHIEESKENLRWHFTSIENPDDCSLLVTKIVQANQFASLLTSQNDVTLQHISIISQSPSKGLQDLDDDESGKAYSQFLSAITKPSQLHPQSPYFIT